MNPYILLAKQAVEKYIKERKIISPSDDLPREFFTKKAGVFVSINTKYKMQNTKYELRGCIGTYLPTRKNIAEEIINNAIAAATEDYRFGPVEKNELSFLSYTIYVLNPPEAIEDIKELNPKKFGIIVKSRGFSPTDAIFNPAPRPYQKSGLLLPDLGGVDTIEKQIYIACQKGGIDRLKEKIIIYKFTVKKYE